MFGNKWRKSNPYYTRKGQIIQSKIYQEEKKIFSLPELMKMAKLTTDQGITVMNPNFSEYAQYQNSTPPDPEEEEEEEEPIDPIQYRINCIQFKQLNLDNATVLNYEYFSDYVISIEPEMQIGEHFGLDIYIRNQQQWYYPFAFVKIDPTYEFNHMSTFHTPIQTYFFSFTDPEQLAGTFDEEDYPITVNVSMEVQGMPLKYFFCSHDATGMEIIPENGEILPTSSITQVALTISSSEGQSQPLAWFKNISKDEYTKSTVTATSSSYPDMTLEVTVYHSTLGNESDEVDMANFYFPNPIPP